MDYALTLYFDKDTESYFNSIISSIANSGASSYMVDTNIPPHITIADFYTEEVNIIVSEVDNNITNFTTGDVIWVSLGSFVPNVLFAAPVMNEYLLNACTNINRLVKPFAHHCGYGQYLPLQWVPHTTLASHLDNDSLIQAFNIATQNFTAVKGKCNRLTLAQCNPFIEIKTWDLAHAQ